LKELGPTLQRKNCPGIWERWRDKVPTNPGRLAPKSIKENGSFNARPWTKSGEGKAVKKKSEPFKQVKKRSRKGLAPIK